MQIDATYTKAYLRRGIAHRRLGQHAQAVTDLDVVLEREPRNHEAAEHRRCSQIELEKAQKEVKVAGGATSAAVAGVPKQSRLIIEEVDGDSDDDAADATPATPAELERLYREEKEKDQRERERAARNESGAKMRPGRNVDPQAMQESEELLGSLAKMAGVSAPPAPPTQQPPKTDVAAHDAQFMPSASFAGPRPGKVFKRGPQGLGYYHDPTSAQKGAAVPAAQNRALGSSSAGMRRLQIEEDDELSLIHI